MTQADSDLRNDLYSVDLSTWANDQALALQEGRFDDLDHPRLADVVAQLAARERHELRDRTGVILTALLRWAEQVDLRCHGWAATIDTQRHLVARLLKDNPSLRTSVPAIVADAYPPAKARAVLESGLFGSSFSESCPFSEADILTDGSFPDPYDDDAVRGVGWWRRR